MSFIQQQQLLKAITRDPEARPSAAELLRDPAIANARAAALLRS